MRIFPLEAGRATVSVYGDGVHDGHDFKALGNAPLSQVEVLVFFDSRGVSGQWDGSLLQLVVDHLAGTPFLALARPLTMTTWATLLNVLVLNELAPRLVLTNVGLVDCTPKKRPLCDDVLAQIRFVQPHTTSRLCSFEPYVLSSGVSEALYSVEYGDEYLSTLRSRVNAQQTIAVKTPLVSPALAIDRARPPAFFSQLEASNTLVDAIGCQAIELGEFDAGLTYDGVHWTAEANRLIFDKIKTVL
jgi:hypothetical protein